MQSLQEKKKNNIENISLFQLCWEFFEIGTIGFGGGWVIISMIKHRFVEQKKLITDEDFTIGISLSQFLGAFAVNTTSFVGRKLRGIWGSILSTFFFLLPSFIIVCILAGLYFKFNKVFNFEHILRGISPVIIALMLSTAFDLSIKIRKDSTFFLIISLVLIGGMFNINYIVLLLFSGLFQVLYSYFIKENGGKLLPIFILQVNKISFAPPVLFSMVGTPSMITISFVFFGIGFIFFGGGYALLPLLQNIFVNKLQWISNHDFIVGIAISQATPGPFAIIATFLGYSLQGILGAFLATLMIFLPAFLFLQILINLQNNFKDNKNVQSFLRGINIAIIGQLLLLSYHFFLDTLTPISVISITLLLSSFIFFFIYRIPPLVFIVIGIVYGFFLIK